MTTSVLIEAVQGHASRRPDHDPLWAAPHESSDGLEAVILGYD